MTNPYRAMCAELVDSLENARRIIQGADGTLHINTAEFVLRRARALLAQPESEESKPVVDYSRVPEIATEAQIRSAAQYLVKKRNCDGDLIPAIEYAIARWGHPTPQPVAVSERLPGPEDCDDEGCCWWWRTDDGDEWWELLCIPDARDHNARCGNARYSHWLPANALPTPEALDD